MEDTRMYTSPFYLTAFQGVFETVRVNKLKVNQCANIVIERDRHITGAERHVASEKLIVRRRMMTF